jgi:cytochrome c biogenesis protein CcdA
VANTIAAFVYVVVLGVAAAAAFLTVGLVGLKVAEVIGDFELVDNLPWLLRFAMVVGALTAGAVTGLLVFSGRRLEMMEQLDKTIAALSSGIMLGLVATVGFVVVFGSVGLILAAGGRVVGKFLPFAGLGVGMLIAGAGLYLLVSKRKLAIMAASRVNLGQGKGLRQIFLFGIAYAIASLSCALPIFLAAIGVVSGQSLSAGAILEPIIGSISYGLGMGVVLVGATIGVVLFKDVVQRGLRAVFPYIEPIGNVAMILAGLYLVYYWAFGTGSELLALRVEELF